MLKSIAVIKINKNDLPRINQVLHSKVKIIKQDDKYYYLKVYEENLVHINTKYEIISYQGIKRIYQLMLLNSSVFIGILLFLSILYFNTLTIKEIRFTTTTKDNEKIKMIIENYMTNYYNIKFLNQDINEINLMLRKEFSHYEWISVEKDGTVLKVNILEPSIINKQVKEIEGAGDLVALKNGVVKYYKVSHGIPIIETNQYVRKGDLLVSGNLRYRNFDESIYYIPAEGVVYAEVWYTKIVEVPKEEVTTEYTGRIKTEKCITIFGLDLKYKGLKKKYDNYDKEIIYEQAKIMNFTLPFGIKKIHYLEKNDIINVYDNNTSYDYAHSSVMHELMKEFKENDKILSIDLLKENHTEDKFIYVFFVRTYEDIALFQRR